MFFQNKNTIRQLNIKNLFTAFCFSEQALIKYPKRYKYYLYPLLTQN